LKIHSQKIFLFLASVENKEAPITKMSATTSTDNIRESTITIKDIPLRDIYPKSRAQDQTFGSQDYNTAAQVLDQMDSMGQAKVLMSSQKTLYKAFVAGIFVTMGGFLSLRFINHIFLILVSLGVCQTSCVFCTQEFQRFILFLLIIRSWLLAFPLLMGFL
jgi:hypothetical protein